MFYFEPDEAIELGVKRILRELMDDSLNRLGDPAGNLDKAVHETRKNFKKMRAVLRLVRDSLGEEIFRAENTCYRDASRKLAPLRDSAVLVETLEAISAQEQSKAMDQALKSAHQHLLKNQEAIRQELLEESQAVEEVQEILREARDRVEHFSLNASGNSAFIPGLERVYRRGQRRMKKAYKASRPELFHDWRKRVKYLWYHAELLQHIWPDYMGSLARELHLLSDYLGDSHDLVVLQETLDAENGNPGQAAQLPYLLDLLAKRQKELETKARPLGKRLYVEPPEMFARRMGVYWQVSQQSGFSGVPEKASANNGRTPARLGLASTKEVAEQLGVSISSVRKKIYKGELTAYKVGQTWAVAWN